MIANEVDKLPKIEQSEHDIQNKIIKMCRDRGALVWRINSGGNISKRGGRIALQKKGTSDTFILYCGVFVAAEIKKPGEKATKEQIEFLQSVARINGIGLLVYDTEFTDRIFNCIQWGKNFDDSIRRVIDFTISCRYSDWKPNQVFVKLS